MKVIDVWTNVVRQAINLSTGLEFHQILRNKQNVLLEPGRDYALVQVPEFQSQNAGTFKNLNHIDYSLIFHLSFYGTNAQTLADTFITAIQDRSNLEMKSLLYRYHMGYNNASIKDAKLYKAGSHVLPVVAADITFSATSVTPESTFSDIPLTYFVIG